MSKKIKTTMNKHLSHLIRLAKVDKALKDVETEVENNKTELNSLVLKQDKLTQSINDEKNNIKHSIISKDKNDLAIQEFANKLEEVAEKQKKIKTERELKSLSVEEDIAKEQISHANNQIQILENKEQDHIETLAKLEEENIELSKDIEKEEKIVEKAVKAIEKNSKSIYKDKAQVEEEIDNKIFSYYEKIKKWAKDTSVVTLEEKVCTGCHMELNDKTYIEVLKRENVTNCLNCGRIVFDDKIDLDNLEETAV